jgi:hypothetical protein
MVRRRAFDVGMYAIMQISKYTSNFQVYGISSNVNTQPVPQLMALQTSDHHTEAQRLLLIYPET